MGMLDLEALLGLPHDQLYIMRGQPGADQQLLAPLEHRAFARDFTRESPLRAVASLPVAIPAYSLAKAVGLQKARSPASLVEMGAAYDGMLEGLRDWYRKPPPPQRRGGIDGTMPKRDDKPSRNRHGGGGVRG